MNNEKWDRRFLDLAKYIAQWSKDPSTKTGAVITRGREIVSVGYNGFPKYVNDDPEHYSNRELKYKMIVHCERNAIILARGSVERCILYTWPFMSCAACAGMVIQSGINMVVFPKPTEDQLSRWGEDFKLSRQMFGEAAVRMIEYGGDDGKD